MYLTDSSRESVSVTPAEAKAYRIELENPNGLHILRDRDGNSWLKTSEDEDGNFTLIPVRSV